MWNIILAIGILFTAGGLIFLLVLGLFYLRKGRIVLESDLGIQRKPEIEFWEKITLRFSFRDAGGKKFKLTKAEWEDKQNIKVPENFGISAEFNEEKSEVIVNVQSSAGVMGNLKVGHADFKSCAVKLFSLTGAPISATKRPDLPVQPSASSPSPPPSTQPTKKEEIPILQPNGAPPLQSQASTSDKPFLKGAEEIKKALDEMKEGIDKIKTSPPDKVTQLIQSMLCLLSLIKVKLQEQTDALHAAGQQGDKQMDSFRVELQKLDAEIRRIEIRITGITLAPTAPPPPPVAPPPPVIVQPSIPREENDGWLITASIFVFACIVAASVYFYIATIQV